MGIPGFARFFDKCFVKKKYEDYLKGSIMVIDGSYQLLRYGIAIRKNGYDITDIDGNSSSHIHAIISYTSFILKLGFCPLYVFELSSPDIKKNTIEARKKIRINAENNLENEDITHDEYIKNFKKTYHLSSIDIKECIKFLEYAGIPYIIAPLESDPQCAALSYLQKNCNVVSEDTDIIIFGSKNLLKNFSGKNEYVKELSLDRIYKFLTNTANDIKKNNCLQEIDFVSHENFIDFAILMGTDYTPHIKGFTAEELYYFFVINDLDIDKTIDYMKKYMNDQKNIIDKYAYIPINFIERAKKAKEYYMNTKIIPPEHINHKLSIPNEILLVPFLLHKGIKKPKITKIIKQILNNYTIFTQINDKHKLENSKSLKSNKLNKSDKLNKSVKLYSYQSFIKKSSDVIISPNFYSNLDTSES